MAGDAVEAEAVAEAVVAAEGVEEAPWVVVVVAAVSPTMLSSTIPNHISSQYVTCSTTSFFLFPLLKQSCVMPSGFGRGGGRGGFGRGGRGGRGRF